MTSYYKAPLLLISACLGGPVKPGRLQNRDNTESPDHQGGLVCRVDGIRRAGRQKKREDRDYDRSVLLTCMEYNNTDNLYE